MEQERKPYKRGRAAKRNPASPLNDSNGLHLRVDVEIRRTIMERAKAMGLTSAEYITRLVVEAGHAASLPDAIMKRLARNAPGGCTPSRYAEIIITNHLNQRGEF